MVTGKSHPGVDSLHRLPPTAAHPEAIATSPPSKRDLASWWRQFKRNTRKEEPKEKPQGIFGIPLNVSIKYANVAISLTNDNGESFIYGYVPIVVAKCGVFLKEKATDVEGIFRLSGSAKRIKDLQEIFDSPERYGKGLDWTGYTVHDAANVLRRYLNQLPEPIVPLDFYERFREPLRTYQRQVQEQIQNNAPPAETEAFDHAKAVSSYQQLIRELPPLNKQLLLYILDLLAVFASKSDQNRMTSANLSAIFQPGLLSHPQHDMSPDEYKLSQDVLIFLIENQDHFLFGMNGTAADEQTVKEVEGGLARRPTTHSNIRRSVSSASGGAESFRKYGSIRRNVSVSSKNSRNSNNASPATPTSLGAVGVHRSNTLPSKMSPAIPPSRYGRAVENTGVNSSTRTSAQHSRSSSHAPPEDRPQPEVPETNGQPSQAQNNIAPSITPPSNGHPSITEVVEPGTGIIYVHSSTHGPVPKTAIENGVPDAGKPVSEKPIADKPMVEPPVAENPIGQQPVAQKPVTQPPIVERLVAERPIPERPIAEEPSTEKPVVDKHLGERPVLREGLPPIAASPPPAVVTPTRERKLSSLFSKSPPPSGEHKDARQPNRLKKKRIPGSASESAQSSSQSLQAATSDTGLAAILHASRGADVNNDAGGATPRAPNTTSSDELSPPREGRPERQVLPNEGGHQTSDTTLRPYGSRTPSMNSRSSFTDYSDADPADDTSRADRKEHRRSWRFPRSSKRSNEHIGLGLASPPLMATTPGADRSTSSIGSWHHSSRSSPSDLQQFANDPSYQPLSLDAEVSNNGVSKEASLAGEPEKRSLFGKFKAKVAQVRDGVKESTERDRTRSPVNSEADRSGSSHTLSPSGKDSIRNRPAPIDVVSYPKEGQVSSPVSPLPGAGLPPAIPEEPRTPESPVAVPSLDQKKEPVAAVPAGSPPPVESEGVDCGPGPAVPS
ncbi:putative Rho GTPase activator (Sac7) [Aspergillus ibericus CBS 121593]|uniref:RhoGAP-domain-containing protein n=1 Tax=Aspergillus ibericus CBS 121593 TaxID=1448316 RepID=A0A395GJQ4_9EURO|nr:RhoGAP-domain-containing protein [Aspergillus ibericus CBS 121593]RAK95725.1 RhoGAP-domain-containing protein [Aspergillus ibericus CBS 121593]